MKTHYAIRAVERLALGTEGKKVFGCTCGRPGEARRSTRGKSQLCDGCTKNEALRREANARGALAGAASLAGFLKVDRKSLSAASATIERRGEPERRRPDSMFACLDGATSGQYDAYDLVQMVQATTEPDGFCGFDRLKAYFLGGGRQESSKKKAALSGVAPEDKPMIAFYIVERLDQIARNMTWPSADRLYAVDSLKAMGLGPGELESGGSTTIDWGFGRPTPGLRSYIKDKLARIANLPKTDSSDVSERARNSLEDMVFAQGRPAARSALEQQLRAFQDLQEFPGEFSERKVVETNKIIQQALSTKLVVTEFLCAARKKCQHEYDGVIKPMCLIEIRGEQYVDGVLQEPNGTDANGATIQAVRYRESPLYQYF